LADPKMQAAYDALVERFVMPLLEGGRVEIGRPIAPGCASFFAQTVPSSEDARLRVFTALVDAADEIHDIETVPFPGGSLSWLAAAAHDLCALTDPSLDRVFVRGARQTIAAWADRWIELVPPPTTRGDALARHALLAPILRMTRTDTVVKNWAYTYRFFGRKPPANVVALPTIRFVRTFESAVGLLELFDKDPSLELPRRYATLVSRSPVTQLLELPEGFRFSVATLSVLADPGLRSGVAKQLSGSDDAGAKIFQAIRAPELVAHPSYLRVALNFALELHMIRALDGSTPKGARSEDGILFDALLAAAFEDDTSIETLRVLDDGDRAILQAHVERVRRTLTDAAALEASRLFEAASP
jgi:hypothetical protein